MSETIGKLSEALAKAQGAMHPAELDCVNPHFKNRYASFASVMKAIREPLSKNGLAVVQEVSSENAGVACKTVLLHSSGERLESRLWLPVAQQTAQAYGSAISYCKRYSLSAMLGVVTGDAEDDGEAASELPKKSKPLPSSKSKEQSGLNQALAVAVPEAVVRAFSDDLLTEKIHHAKEWIAANPNLDKKTLSLAEKKLAQFQAEAKRRTESANGLSVLPVGDPQRDYEGPGSKWTGD